VSALLRKDWHKHSNLQSAGSTSGQRIGTPDGQSTVSQTQYFGTWCSSPYTWILSSGSVILWVKRCQNGHSLWGYCRQSDAPHRDGVNDLRSHAVLCPSQASAVFCPSHLHFIPSRLGSYKVVPILYRDVSVFAGHVFPLRPHGHNVSWFPDVDPRNGKPPARMCWPSSLEVLRFKTFMQMIHSYVLTSKNNTKFTNYSVERIFHYKVVRSTIRGKLQKFKWMQQQQRYLNSLLNGISVINLKRKRWTGHIPGIGQVLREY